ncbi:MAG: hypothetical protein WKG32_15010, partial [Gemmatimonadaceae bacterium]
MLMLTAVRVARGTVLGGALAVTLGTLAACDMDVSNPSVIDAESFDPTADASTLSLSAQSNLYRAVTGIIPFSAFLSQEAWVGVVRPETNDIGRRVLTTSTSDVNAVWSPLQLAIATNELAAQVLAANAGAQADINLARVYMNAGFALELMAEHFCQGAFLVGPALTPEQVSDTAIVRFSKALPVGAAAAAAGVVEGTKVV